MGLLDRLFPWFDPKEEEVKDARAELAILKGRKAESHVRTLAQTYRAAGILLHEVRVKPKPSDSSSQ